MSNLMRMAAADCHVSEEWIQNVVVNGANRVKLLKISRKGSSKSRVVHRPSAELELLQRWLTLRFFNNLNVHGIAMAFKKNTSILHNAERHRNSKYFVRVDFKDFFNSIKFADVVSVVSGYFDGAGYALVDGDLELIRKICFTREGRLPVGYISSPSLSNAVMYEFDVKLVALMGQCADKLGNAVVTRYADDVVFSTDIKGGCNNFLEIFRGYVKACASPKLTINEDKTIFTSRPGGSAIVTGLRVCQDGHITVTRKYKDEIRLLLSLFEKRRLKKEDYSVLRGHLSYIQFSAPAFFSKLCAKYYLEIESIRSQADHF